jgi:hypothetical protein
MRACARPECLRGEDCAPSPALYSPVRAGRAFYRFTLLGAYSLVWLARCPLCPDSDQVLHRSEMSRWAHLQTHAVQQTVGLLNHLVSTAEQRKLDVQPKRSGCLEVDDQFNLGSLLDW